jgi:hypothetical protein
MCISNQVSINMKSTINFTILLTMASVGLAVPQGLGVQYVEPGSSLPGAWLYKGEISS